MAERTDLTPIDEALHKLLNQPSYAAQTLLVTARMLELDADQPMTQTAREQALDIGADTILSRLPDAVHEDSLARAYKALPAVPSLSITRGEFALRVRKAAEALR
ncbi:hypothetical protein [Streptomyces marianii]|uniref:Uncharacterized protein n=1 Tax=Streptomyces marianii TaxID=1817406 RepID=A0A5R9E9Q8_9ACTN|nr:hypothetical protein [Streptomyces marianii]TLQ45775.1 hypothetical protein FEF34_24755 [Streptomyces marianii]